MSADIFLKVCKRTEEPFFFVFFLKHLSFFRDIYSMNLKEMSSKIIDEYFYFPKVSANDLKMSVRKSDEILLSTIFFFFKYFFINFLEFFLEKKKVCRYPEYGCLIIRWKKKTLLKPIKTFLYTKRNFLNCFITNFQKVLLFFKRYLFEWM